MPKTNGTYKVGQRPHLDIRKKASPEIKDLAKAMTRGNVEAVVAIVYMTDGDVWRIWDVGRKEAHDVAGDLIELSGRLA